MHLNFNLKITDPEIVSLITDKQYELSKDVEGKPKPRTPYPDTVLKLLKDLIKLKKKK